MRQAQQQHRHFSLNEASSSCSIAGHQQQHQEAPLVPLRLDRQIQTSPSDSPAAWPPPSVHGSPRNRRAIFEDADAIAGGGRCECASAAAARTRQPTRRELYQWLSTAEPGARLFRSKYIYRPLRDSPNDNPETELSLTPGDYLLIFGDLDEDFYYRGELWTGERGLVPSNYVEAVTGGVLGIDTCAPTADTSSLLMIARQHRPTPTTTRLLSRAASERVPAGMGPGSSVSAAALAAMRSARSVDVFVAAFDAQQQQQYPASFGLSALSSLNTDELGQSDPYLCPFPVVDVSNVQVQEIRPFDGARVPCPRDLLVERQLTKSVLISWSPPVNALCPIAQYHVCVDGEVRAVVPAGYKTKALIEDVDSRKIHRISVRAISDAGPSPDEACTVTLGRGSLIRPQDLKISNVTPVSCDISWYPSHSSCEHLVLLNGLKVGSCPAGVYRVQVRSLIPSTMYRCAIRVKDPKAVLEEKPVESFVDFKTLPKIGLPDPPSDVHCEPGPQDGTLLVTWRPVTTQPKPPSRAAVAGYLVYADGRKVCEVDSSSGDHAVLRLQDLSDDPPLFITVKTKTREGAISSDSNVVRVPRTGAGGGITLQPPGTDVLQSLGGRATTSQVANNASTQEALFAASAPGYGQGTATSTTTTTAPLPVSLAQFTSTATTENPLFTTSTTTAPSYYVFHPRLTAQQLDTTITTSATGSGGVSDLLGFGHQQEKPSLLEMETDYLSRHHQLQERAAAYQSALTRPGTSAVAASRLAQQQHQQQAATAALAARQAAFGRRSYSLDEAPGPDYDTYAVSQTRVQLLPQQSTASGVGMADSVVSPFHPIKHLRSAASAVTAFNGPNHRALGLGAEHPWSDTNPFRQSVALGQTARFDSRTAGNAAARGVGVSGFWPQQSEKLLPYGDLDAAPVGSIYSNQSNVAGTTARVLPSTVDSQGRLGLHGGILSSRHRRRLQDTAEARTLSEPDLLHYDINQRYLPHPTHAHQTRRRRSKTPTRLVVALYDYSPRHMSPNPNGHFDELPFRKGQLITILGDKDADGFYRGELDGRVGLVPGNLVVEVEGGVHALLNSPPTSAAIDYETQAGVYSGGLTIRYRESARSAARDQYYGPATRAYGDGGIWNGGSDPLLSRNHQRLAAAREQQQLAVHAATASSFDNAYDRYSDQDRYGTGQARHRRNKYKQKSHSLEYDLDRREAYYDQEGVPYDQQPFRRSPHGKGGAYSMEPDYDHSSRLAARSLDRVHYQRQQPVPVRGDTYGPQSDRSGSHRPMQPGIGGRQQKMWPSQPGYREGGISNQDSEAELLHYQRQQQRKPGGQPRRMSMLDQRQQPMGGDFYGDQEGPWRNEEPLGPQQFTPSRQRGAAGYDRNGASVEETLRRGPRAYPGEEQLMAESRKLQKQQQQLPPSSEMFYDSPSDTKEASGGGRERRRGSLRRGGRQQMEQNIRDAMMGGGARRMVAKFDYDPKILSPNPGAEREELTFRAGDMILVYGDVDEDGFYIGELGGRRGLIPSNYLMWEQDVGMNATANQPQFAQQGMQQQQQPGTSSQQAMYEAPAVAAAGTGTLRSKKDSLVSFAPTMGVAEVQSPAGAQPSFLAGPSGMEKKVPSQASKPSAAPLSGQKAPSSSAGGAKRQPGQLKKADSTVGQKVPQKKASVAGGPAPTRKASSAVATGKGPGTRTGGQEDGGFGKVWKKIVE